MTNSITYHSRSGVMFSGPLAVKVYTATVLAAALRMYAKTGVRANSAYKPTAMLLRATSITGNSYQRGQYALAADDLDDWKGHAMKHVEVVQP